MGTTIFPEPLENHSPIDHDDLKRWVEAKIAFEKEAGDPDNYVDGLQYLLRTLKIRERCAPRRVNTPALDGVYSGPSGIGDAIAAVATTMVAHPVMDPVFHIKVWVV